MFPLNASNMENTFRTTNTPQSNDSGYRSGINQMDISDSDACRAKADLTNLKVTVGIDEDLQMILEMDPSIVDLVRKDITLCHFPHFEAKFKAFPYQKSWVHNK